MERTKIIIIGAAGRISIILILTSDIINIMK